MIASSVILDLCRSVRCYSYAVIVTVVSNIIAVLFTVFLSLERGRCGCDTDTPAGTNARTVPQ